MSKRKLNKEQMVEITKNKNVSKCSEKSITYNNDFKIKAVKQYYDEYMLPNEIFEQAGFDLDIIGRRIPNKCLSRWKKVFQNKGVMFLNTENRGKGGGRPKKIKDKSDKDKIERLEATVAYLKAENDFLAKLRAKRNR
jgi:hypothetical protein